MPKLNTTKKNKSPPPKKHGLMYSMILYNLQHFKALQLHIELLQQ